MTDESKKVRLNVRIDPDAAALLDELAGSRYRAGEYLSNLIRQAAAERSNGQAGLRSQISDVAATLRLALGQLENLAGQTTRDGGSSNTRPRRATSRQTSGEDGEGGEAWHLDTG